MAIPTYNTPIFPCTSRVVARNSIVQARMLIREMQLTLSSSGDNVPALSVSPSVHQIAHELAVAENALTLCGC